VSWAGDLDSLEGWYGVQAVLKINRNARSVEAAGNAATTRNVVFIEKENREHPLDLLFHLRFKERPAFKESEFLKEVNIPSDLMTRFSGRPESLQAAVVLPPGYFQNPEKTYPTLYAMGGWGASHYDAIAGNPQKRYGVPGFGEEKILVFINHECRTGYHVFCSSETNGPREESFFRELVPYIEREYRVDKNPGTRFLTGQSSGAWAALWLLIKYPDQFGGAYALAPDPVDFTEFTGTNIYAKNANMYTTAEGATKYFNSREDVKDKDYIGNMSIRDFVGLDRIAGWGEQMSSFDATFSPKDGAGEPRRLFDWNTGAVDPEVAASWESHDLSKVVSRMDAGRKEILAGKIHVFAAEDDDFGMNRPVRAFERTLKAVGLEAEIRFFVSGGHNLWTDDLRKAIHADIDAKCAALRAS
jgi:S-formylglutathione hydrolase FrmB